MTPRTIAIDARLERYIEKVGLRETPEQTGLREATDALPQASMRSSAVQIALLQWLLRTMDARSVLEIGTFTGYGTLGFALALPADGTVTTLDYTSEWPEIGRPFWRQAKVEAKIALRTGLALDNLDALLGEGRAASFDLVYIDADKKTYEDYLERAKRLVRKGGVVALDNVLWSGSVADETDRSRQTATLRRVNERVAADPDLEFCLLPIGDGLTLTRKI